MGRVIKNTDASEVTSVSLDEEVLTGQTDRIPAEKVEAEETEEEDEVTPQGQVLRAGEAGRSAEPVPVRPEEVAGPETADEDPTTTADEPDSETQEASSDDSSSDEGSAGPTRTDEEWRAHLEEKVEAARAEGYEEGREDGYEAGYDDGYEEAEATVRAELEAQHQQLIEDTTRFEQLWETYLDEAESQMVELSLDLAETIANAPLTESMRRASEEAVIEAVTELSSAPPVTVRLHPVDCQRVRESGLAERLKENFDGFTLEPEPDFEEGDWSVSSPTGVIRRLRDEVLETLRTELGHAISADEPDAPNSG